MDLKPGDSFDRYTIERLLGQGGMGRVYSARDDKLRRPVALKLLRLTSGDSKHTSEEGSALLLREARAAAALDHANAISIYDVGEVDGVPFIAMELVDGTPLRARIGDDSIPVDTRVRWLAEVARALAAAHARGLVHRDIKPENVMVRRDGTIKVLDFGIARPQAWSPDKKLSEGAPAFAADEWKTESTLAGTPRYMAPEQLRRDQLDGRTDQFAWGVLAYELLTGKTPWESGKHGAGRSVFAFHPGQRAGSCRAARARLPRASVARRPSRAVQEPGSALRLDGRDSWQRWSRRPTCRAGCPKGHPRRPRHRGRSPSPRLPRGPAGVVRLQRSP